MPAILACVLAATLRPAARWLRARGLGPTSATVVATAGSGAVVLLIVAVTIVSIAASASDMVARASEGAASTGLGSAPVDLVAAVGSAMTFNLDTLFRNLAAISLIVLLIMLLTYFLLRDGPSWWQRRPRSSAGRPPATARLGRSRHRRDPQRLHGRHRVDRACSQASPSG